MTETMLIVEDDHIYAQVLASAMARRGIRAIIAGNALEAGNALAQHFDYVILDLKLGSDSGLDLIARIRKALPNARLILLTGYASIATAVEAIKLGADDYLPKPATPDDILARLKGERMLQQDLSTASPRRLEWEHIQRVLNDNGGNISAAARALGMHRRTLQRKLSKRPVYQ